jgi:hypothetical protein
MFGRMIPFSPGIFLGILPDHQAAPYGEEAGPQMCQTPEGEVRRL